MREIMTEATVLDSTHLMLDHSLPESWGQRLLVRITPVSDKPEHLLHEPRAAYLTTSKQERRAEVALAEEGLLTQPDPSKAFPDIVLNAKQAMIAANQFIVNHLPDRFSAGLPKLVLFPLRPLWLVPVHLTYPGVGVVGEIGMLAVDGDRPVVVGWTPLEKMEALAHQLYEENRDEIEFAFS